MPKQELKNKKPYLFFVGAMCYIIYITKLTARGVFYEM